MKGGNTKQMKQTYSIIRCDYYNIEIEADSEADAIKKANENDEYLNNGVFLESVFKNDFS